MSTTDNLEKVPTATAHVASFDPKTATESQKLENGWRWVTIPDKDPYDYVFAGIYLNNEHFKPGVHLMHPDKADAIEERLVAFARYNTRLMRPSADLTSLSQIPGNRG